MDQKKPFTFAEFLVLVRRAWAQQKAQRSSPRRGQYCSESRQKHGSTLLGLRYTARGLRANTRIVVANAFRYSATQLVGSDAGGDRHGAEQ